MIKKRVLVASFCCCLSGVSFGMLMTPIHSPVVAPRAFTVQEDAVLLSSLRDPNYALKSLQEKYAEIEDGKWFLADLYPIRSIDEVLARLAELESDLSLRQAAQERVKKAENRAALARSIPRPKAPIVWLYEE